MNSPLTKHDDGNVTWFHQEGDKYDVTGVDVYGKRFSLTFDCWFQALSINLYCGNKWLVRNGKRYKIITVSN